MPYHRFLPAGSLMTEVPRQRFFKFFDPGYVVRKCRYNVLGGTEPGNLQAHNRMLILRGRYPDPMLAGLSCTGVLPQPKA